MKIRKMDATFGKLIRKSLSLGDGLNIVCGDNESGKSTWCGFIRTMLYGIRTREHSKIGYIADKERYLPWSGEGMHGRMELSCQGKEISIERKSGRTGIFQAPEVTDNSTGLPIPGMEIPGEAMLGVKKEVFERSAFIAQAQLKVENDASGELERRIVSLASSGEEDVSYSQAESRLKSWKNRRRFNKRGEAVELEGEISELGRKLELLREDARALTFKKASIEKLRESLNEYQKQLQAWEYLRAWEKANMQEDARREQDEAQAQYQEALSAVRFGDRVADEGYCRELEEIYRKYIEDQKKYTESIEVIREAEGKLNRAEQELSEFGELAETARDASADTVRAQEIEKELEAKVSKTALWICLAIGGALIAGAVAMFLSSLIALGGVLSVCGVIAIVAGAIINAKAVAEKKEEQDRLKAELDGIFRIYRVADASEICKRASAYAEKKREYDTCRVASIAHGNHMQASEFAKKQSTKLLLDAIGEIKPGAVEADAAQVIDTIRGRVQDLKRAKDRLDTARIRLDAVRLGSGEVSEKITRPEGQAPQLGEAELKDRIERISAQLRELELDSTALKAKISQIGDQGDLQEQLRQKRELINIKSAEVSAIEYALDELSQVNGFLARRFAPELEKKAGEIFKYLTGGHFGIVEIRDAKMEVLVREESAAPTRQVLELSQGTADELYLSMRLAISDILTQDEPIPLVLDDAFVNFDDKRMAKALDYLNTLAKDRQVIIFTCQRREAEYAKKFDNCTVVDL